MDWTDDWHWLALGLLGNAVFFSRFLVQWVASERAKRSIVPTAFWWLSIVGSLPGGLLGTPDMHVTGNGSAGNSLVWFADRSESALPVATAFTVPIWVYKVLILAWALWSRVQAERLERDVASRFAAEPGYVVTGHSRNGNEISVAGLRDPLAVPPESVLAAVEVEAENVTLAFKPYQSLDEDIVLRRLRTALRGDADLDLQIEGTRLLVRGNLTSRQFGLLEDLPGSHPLIGKVDLQQARLEAQEAAQLAARRLDAPASVTISPSGDRLEISGTASAAWFEGGGWMRWNASWLRMA